MSRKSFAVWAVILAAFTAIAIALIIKNETGEKDETKAATEAASGEKTEKESTTEAEADTVEPEESTEAKSRISVPSIENTDAYESEEIKVTGTEIIHLYSDPSYIPSSGMTGTAELIFYDDYTCRFRGVIADAFEYDYVTIWSNDEGLTFESVRNVLIESKNTDEAQNASKMGLADSYSLNLFHQTVNTDGTVRIYTSGSNAQFMLPLLGTAFEFESYEIKNLGIDINKLPTETVEAPTYQETEEPKTEAPTEDESYVAPESAADDESGSSGTALLVVYYTTDPNETAAVTFYSDCTVTFTGTVAKAYTWTYNSNWEVKNNILVIEDKSGIKVECISDSVGEELKKNGLEASYTVSAVHSVSYDGSAYCVSVCGSDETLVIFQPSFILSASEGKTLGLKPGSGSGTASATEKETEAGTESRTTSPTVKPTQSATEKETEAKTEKKTEKETEKKTEKETEKETQSGKRTLLVALEYVSEPEDEEDDMLARSTLLFYSDYTVEHSGTMFELYDYSYSTTWEIKNGTLVITDVKNQKAECTDSLVKMVLAMSSISESFDMDVNHTVTKSGSGYTVTVSCIAQSYTYDKETVDNAEIYSASFTLEASDAKKLGLN